MSPENDATQIGKTTTEPIGGGYSELETRDGQALLALLDKSDQVLVKKLSNNDRSWSFDPKKHQAGVFIPHRERDSGFFPSLSVLERPSPSAHEIREALLDAVWIQDALHTKHARLVHYASKGQETHLTRLPKSVFAELAPASWLVIGRFDAEGEHRYLCMTVDSTSEESSLLTEILNIGPEFSVGVLNPDAVRKQASEEMLDFVEQVVQAWLAGKLNLFAKKHATMPETSEIARMARERYFSDSSFDRLDPFAMDYPGDALRTISRVIEYQLFRQHQRRERAVGLVRAVLGEEARDISPDGVVRRLFDNYWLIDSQLLSASQQRKARAGRSYELHIEAMLVDGNIPFEKQKVIPGRSRPDFILPSLSFVDGASEHAGTGLILSAKTTLRERWKQVLKEKNHRRMFLTTVDDTVSSSAIENMAELDVQLVVPESLKKSDETEYSNHTNVLSFREFCDTVIKPALSAWSC